MGGWRPSFGAQPEHLVLGPAADGRALRRLERALGVELPPDLRDLLGEVDGVSTDGGTWVVWPADRIVSENLAMRADEDLVTRCMPFDSLLFFGEAANGDRFASPIRGGRAGSDVFRWEEATDSRSKVAAGLEQYIVAEVAPGFERHEPPAFDPSVTAEIAVPTGPPAEPAGLDGTSPTPHLSDRSAPVEARAPASRDEPERDRDRDGGEAAAVGAAALGAATSQVADDPASEDSATNDAERDDLMADDSVVDDPATHGSATDELAPNDPVVESEAAAVAASMRTTQPLTRREPKSPEANVDDSDEVDELFDVGTATAAAAVASTTAGRLTHDMEPPVDESTDAAGSAVPPSSGPWSEPEPDGTPAQPPAEPMPAMVTATDMPYGSGPIETSKPNRVPALVAAAAVAIIVVAVLGLAIAMTRGGDEAQTATRTPSTAAPTTATRPSSGAGGATATTASPTTSTRTPSGDAASTGSADQTGTTDTTDTTASTDPPDTTAAENSTSTTATPTTTGSTGSGGNGTGSRPVAVPVTTIRPTTTTVPPAILVAGPSSGTHRIPKGGSMQMIVQNVGNTPGSFVLWSDGVTLISQSAGTLAPGAVVTITISAAPGAEGASPIRGALEGTGGFGFTVFIENGID